MLSWIVPFLVTIILAAAAEAQTMPLRGGEWDKIIEAAKKEREARLEEQRQRKYAEGINRFVQDDFLRLTSVEGQDRFGAGHCRQNRSRIQGGSPLFRSSSWRQRVCD